MRACNGTKISFLFKYIYKVNEIGIIILTGNLKMKLKIHMKEQRSLLSIDL